MLTVGGVFGIISGTSTTISASPVIPEWWVFVLVMLKAVVTGGAGALGGLLAKYLYKWAVKTITKKIKIYKLNRSSKS